MINNNFGDSEISRVESFDLNSDKDIIGKGLKSKIVQKYYYRNYNNKENYIQNHQMIYLLGRENEKLRKENFQIREKYQELFEVY